MSQIQDKYLIVGLGNSGQEFVGTPHNIGWRVVEALAKEYDCHFKNNKAIAGKFCQFDYAEQKIFLLLPETYMNKSGLSVKSALQYWEIGINDLLVVQDDSDIHLEKIKLGFDQSSGGHKGLQSIITTLGSQKFARLKIGVRPPQLAQSGKKYVKAEKFILKKLPPNHEGEIVNLAKEAVFSWVDVGLAKTMSKYNKSSVVSRKS